MTPLRKFAPLVTFAIIMYLSFSNINLVLGAFSRILSVFMPLLIGIAIAFVLNLLLKPIERFIDKTFKSKKIIVKNKRVLAVIATYTITFTVIVMIVLFIVPQVTESSKSLIDKLPEYGKQITAFGTRIYDSLNLPSDILDQVFTNFRDVFVGLSEFTASTIMTVLNMTLNITSGALTLFIGLIFSVYLLLQKEKLIHILKKVNYAFNKIEVADYLSDVGKESTTIFSKFVGGQLTEALILGTLCFIGLIIFNIPYAPLISVMIAITSLIPVVGAFIGTVPSVLIIAMENPTQALFFIIFIVILQQIEGNLIYPKVVGDAIGIGGFWVFLAITVGGGFYGILGMLFGVPTMAILYTVIRRWVDKRLKDKKIKV